jgi:outer membrane receptor protein involved in Fe transport
MDLPKINTLMYFSAFFMLTFDAYAQNSAIEEVIVSAEKRNESLQDVSISVTALTEDVLETKKYY